MLSLVHYIGNFISTVGILILLFTLRKDFGELSLIKKVSIYVLSAGILIPFAIEVIYGFINGVFG
ncbi:hypothetical protein FD06_GL000102 [Apilactobacillus ozensis DSM 23829 = JCM 17196]|uniref:Uncharacterized protein n=1 Tax=Apilactobacillus ozensis DSM 23829 = JCM 17196 TaxID=1423781 RepID=A0A0R2AT83_9LACO|nr:hypothetical protein [Apilactobacillus ozensis]KRM69935.1 hypothetical protein FD06_GL000102 [Apilactobacillus ozensis DSM 23829 = JCM 17196]